MKKQEYIDMGIEAGLTPSQIEGVLCKVLSVSREEFFLLKNISSKYIYEVQQVFYSLQTWKPEEYTLEKANFYGRDFFVDERVLIPRNDTEILVREALKKIHLDMRLENMIYIDVGTGSACIPITIIEEMKPLKFEKVFALDISSEALAVAKENIEAYTLENIELLKSDLLHGIFHHVWLTKKSLCITANLPYIKDEDHENMDQSVIHHKRKKALYGREKTGFELYEKLLKQCFQLKEIYKIPMIYMFIEIGFDQYDYSRKYLEDLGLRFEYFTDSANIKRVICIEGF